MHSLRATSIALAASGLLLAGACAGSSAHSSDSEYRVVDAHVFYGLESAAALADRMERGEFLDLTLEARNRWAADGWDLSPEFGELGDSRFLLRRSRGAPAPFEVLFVLQKDLARMSVAEAQDRIDQLVRQGWRIASSNALMLEFRRAR